MREKGKVHRRTLALLPIGVLFFLLLVKSQAMTAAAQNALFFVASTLIPALFPFAVLARILAVGELLPTKNRFAGWLADLFGISREGLPAFFLGLFCGYPMGAYTAFCLLEEDRIGSKEAYTVASVSNNASAPFLLLTVSSLFGDSRVGLTLFLSVTAASLLVGLLRSAGAKKQSTPLTDPTRLPSASRKSFLPVLSDAIVKGGTAMLSVAAFVVFFATVSEACRLLSPVAIAPVFPALLETTAAIRTAQELVGTIGIRLATTVAAASTGWSGFSVILQTVAQFQGKIPLFPLVITRAAIAALSAAIAYAIFPFL